MTVRLILAFFAFWVLVLGHYVWSAAHLQPALGEIEFNDLSAAGHRIGPLPMDLYRVVVWVGPRDDESDEEHALTGRRLQEGCVRITIRVTGFGGRDVLEYESSNYSRDWAYSPMASGPRGWWGPARFRAFPLERYQITARLTGENEFLENQKIWVALKAQRDAGYHGISHILVFLVTGLLIALIAIVWIVAKLNSYRRR